MSSGVSEFEAMHAMESQIKTSREQTESNQRHCGCGTVVLAAADL
jgi:hypothetical protein